MPKSATAEQAHVFDRTRQHQKKREALILAAAHAFHENGYAGTTLDMIASRLGVTKKALYHYVDGKNEILFEIFSLWLDMQAEAIAQAAKQGRTADEKVRLYARQYVTAVYRNLIPMDRIVGEIETLDESAVKTIQRRRRANDKKLREFFEAGAGKEFADWDPKYAVYVLNGAIDWMFKWLKPEGPEKPDAAADKVVDILMQGLTPR
ncbi:MAG: TetR/AcrR family transcriptional regulator [Pseudomonadota bacterium]